MPSCLYRAATVLLVALLPAAGAHATDAVGEALFHLHCASCHLSEAKPRPAPPAAAVRKRYRRAAPEREAFIEAVAGWLANPDPEQALMRRAVTHHGPMPAVVLTDANRRAIAGWLYDAPLPAMKGHGKGHGGGQAGADGGPGGHGHGQGDAAGPGAGGADKGTDGAGGCRGGGHGKGDGACKGAPVSGPGAPADNLDAVAVSMAEAAAQLAPFKQSLMQALKAGLAQGAVDAVKVCRLQAPAIAAGHSEATLRVGRASDRLRNPANTPPDWAAPVLSAWVEQPAMAAPMLLELGDGRRGYLEPITVKPLCLTCHGERLAEDVRAEIDRHYPTDRATGYREGDLRGLFWLETAAGR